MKSLITALFTVVTILFSGCMTTGALSLEEQAQYEKVAVISTLGDEFTANHAKNYLLAIQNNMWRQHLGAESYNAEFENYVVKILQDKVPFDVVAMHQFYEKDSLIISNLNQSLGNNRKFSEFLLENGFDGAVLLMGRRIVPGNPYDGIDLVYDELGIYKSGKKVHTFCHFILELIDAEKKRIVFADVGLKMETAVVKVDPWPSEEVSLDTNQLSALKLQSFDLAKKNIDEILTKRFLNLRTQDI